MKKFLSAISVVLILLSCSKDGEYTTIYNDFRLEVLVFGGMCGYEKEVLITESLTKVKITSAKHCNGGLDSSSSYVTDPEKLKLLKAKLEEVKFKELQLNECFRCSDGIDYQIKLVDKRKVYENTIALRMNTSTESVLDLRLKELQQIIDSF